jgi:hypothetical protein
VRNSNVMIARSNPSNDLNESIPGFELFQARQPRFIRAEGTLEREYCGKRSDLCVSLIDQSANRVSPSS